MNMNLDHVFSPLRGQRSVFEADGYLTAIAIGPDETMPWEWLGDLLGTTEQERFSELTAQVDATMTRYQAILDEIAAGNPRPLYIQGGERAMASLEDAEAWAAGFWDAMQFCGAPWGQLIRDRDARGVLSPILSLVKLEDGKTVLDGTEEEIAERQKDAATLIPTVLPLIQAYWKDRQRRSSKQPGRNEPCPCGSSKKFKKCRGA